MTNSKFKNIFLAIGIFSILLTGVFFICHTAEAKTVSSLFLRGPGCCLTQGEYENIAKYDAAMLRRYWYYHDDFYNPNENPYGTTWQTLKHYNPDIQVFLYDMAYQTITDQDSYEPAFAYFTRFYNDMIANHPDYFLYHGVDKVYDTGYSSVPTNYIYFLDVGNSGLRAYVANSIKDDVASQPWAADGIFFDGPPPMLPDYTSANFDLYPTNAVWQGAACGFVNYLANSLRSGSPSQKTMVNFGNTRYEDVASGWLYLDSLATPPDFMFEESAFAVRWGPWAVQFYSEEEWKRQVDLMAQVTHSGTAWFSHTDLTKGGPSGSDNLEKTVTYNDVLWFSLGSYLVGRPVASGKALFAFNNDEPIPADWQDEFELDIGEPVGNYNISSISGNNIYWREYEKGYAYVNSTNNDVASILLPQTGKQLNHNNLKSLPSTIPDTNSISLASHRGTIVLKSASFPVYQAADINQDNSINLSDFNLLKADFLKLAAALANSRSDINGDGQATIKDVGILMSGWR